MCLSNAIICIILGTGSVRGDFGNLLDFLMQLKKLKVIHKMFFIHYICVYLHI